MLGIGPRKFLVLAAFFPLQLQTGCGDSFEAHVVGGPNAVSDKEISDQSDHQQFEYLPGAKVVVKGTDAHPLITADPSRICNGIQFYNANGDLVSGTANCTVQIQDPNLKPENIRNEVSIAGVTGALQPSPGSCSSDGQQNCVSGPNYPAVEASALASKLAVGQSIAGINGNFDGTFDACASDGQNFCLSNAAFPAVDINLVIAGNIRSGVVLAGVTGAYPSVAYPLASATVTPDLTSLGPATPVGSYEFFDSTGNRHEGTVAAGGTINPSTAQQDFITASTVYRSFSVAGDANLVNSNIRNAEQIFGVTGNVVESPGVCSGNGSQDCVATGSYFAAQACGANGSLCFVRNYVQDSQSLKAIDYDAIDEDKMLMTQTIDGKTGTIESQGIWDLSATFPGAGYYTGSTNAPDADEIISGHTILGVAGNVTARPEDCELHQETGCVTVADFPAVDISLVIPANIKAAVQIGSVAGAYPSEDHPLASADGEPNLTSLGSATAVGTYQFFDSAGTRYEANVADGGLVTPSAVQQDFSSPNTVYRSFSVAGDGNLLNTNIKDEVAIFGVTGSVVESPGACTVNGSQSCVAAGSFYAAQDCIGNDSQCYLPSYNLGTEPLKAINYDAIDPDRMLESLTIGDKEGTIAEHGSWDLRTAFPGAGYITGVTDAPDASSILTGSTIVGVGGIASAAPADCEEDGELACVAVASFPAIELSQVSEGEIRAGIQIGGVTGAYPSVTYPLAGADSDITDLTSLGPTTAAGDYEFFDSAGNRYLGTIAEGGVIDPDGSLQVFSDANTVYNSFSVAGDVTLVSSNIKAGVTIYNVTGNVVESPGVCSGNGSQNCVATGDYFAAQTCGANGSLCYVPSYAQGSQPLKAIDYDAIDEDKMLTTQAIDGKTGAIVSRGSWDLSVDFPGVGYYSGSSNAPTATNIKRGSSIAGVTGNFPSAASPLPRYVDDGATTDIFGTDLPDLTMFITQLTTDGDFEFWDSRGQRYTGSGDSNLTAANIREGVSIANLSITGTMPLAPIVTPTGFFGYYVSGTDRNDFVWDDMDLAGYLLIVREGAAVDWTPTHGQVYGEGSQGANEVIYVGASLSASHHGIVHNEVYHYALYAYNANYYYSAVPSTTVITTPAIDCSGLAGGVWVGVPGDPDYGTSDFCVMKYHAKYVGGTATSQATDTPWIFISRLEAIDECEDFGAGFRLISNPEWMTIAANIANLGGNWSGGSVGSGSLNRGHSDNSPSNPLAASTNDNDACTGTEQSCNASTWDLQRRTFRLSTGEMIWDFAGNVATWVDYARVSGKPTPVGTSWNQYPSVGDGEFTTKDMLVPINAVQSWWNDSWDSTQGIGQYYGGLAGQGGAMRRGGHFNDHTNAGVFTASLHFASNTSDNDRTGFRCTATPP